MHGNKKNNKDKNKNEEIDEIEEIYKELSIDKRNIKEDLIQFPTQLFLACECLLECRAKYENAKFEMKMFEAESYDRIKDFHAGKKVTEKFINNEIIKSESYQNKMQNLLYLEKMKNKADNLKMAIDARGKSLLAIANNFN